MVNITITIEEPKKALPNVAIKNTSQYCTNSITSRSIFNWNDMNKKINETLKITRKNFIILCKRYFSKKNFMQKIKVQYHETTNIINKLIKNESYSL